MVEHGSQALLATTETICSFGARWMGSQAVDRVKRFLSQELAPLGLRLIRQRFAFPAFSPQEARVRVRGQGEDWREIVCEPVAFARPSPHPFAAGLADAAGAAGVDSVHLVSAARPAWAYAQAVRRQARGVILATDLPGQAIRCVVCREDGQPGAIPGVSIAGEDARRLLRRLDRGEALEAEIFSPGGTRQSHGENLLFHTPGRQGPPVLLLAHYDSLWNGVHAAGGAAGLALLLHLARELAWETRAPLCLGLLGARCLGGWGLAACAEGLRRQGWWPAAVLELGGFGVGGGRLAVASSSSLETLCLDAVGEVGADAVVRRRALSPEDPLRPLAEAGVPVARLDDDATDPCLHTPLDLPSRLEDAAVSRALALARGLFLRMCDS